MPIRRPRRWCAAGAPRARHRAKPAPEDWSIHGQLTVVGQGYPGFPSTVQGPNSLPAHGEVRETISGTAFLGRRLPWEGGELYFDPEFNQGFGLDRTLGVDGFPNGEAQKAGFETPKPNVARLFLRQTFGLGGEQETLDPDQNQLGENLDIDRVTVTAGKLAVPDIFDDNQFAHDPRTTFLNWSLWEAAAWDYPADQKGYTDGLAVELNQKDWALRGGWFLEPKIANERDLDGRFWKHYGTVAELETRHHWLGEPGTLRFLAFANRADMGNLQQAVDLAVTTGTPANIAAVRHDSWKAGWAINLEQSLTDDLGFFSRLSWNDGHTEGWAFTDIDQSVSLGAQPQRHAVGPRQGHHRSCRRGQRPLEAGAIVLRQWRHRHSRRRWQPRLRARRHHRSLLRLQRRRPARPHARLSVRRQPRLQPGARPRPYLRPAPACAILERALWCGRFSLERGRTTMYEQILYAVEDGIATITLNRPEKLNAFTNTMRLELIAAFDAVDADDDVRAVIVTGAGRAFCAGADLSAGGKTFDYAARGAIAADEQRRDGGGTVSLRIFECKKPVIAAVNGPAVGVGATMQLPMDIRLAADGARFGFVFTRRGVVPEACSSWFLPRLVGIQQALDWVLSGRVFDAQEARTAASSSVCCRWRSCCRRRAISRARSPTTLRRCRWRWRGRCCGACSAPIIRWKRTRWIRAASR